MRDRTPVRILSRGGWGVLFEKRLRPDVRRDVHRHREAAFTLTVGGSYLEEFETGAAQDVVAGRVQFKTAGIPHTTCGGPDGALLWILAPADAAMGASPAAVTAGPDVATARMLALHDAAASRDAAQADVHARRLAAHLAATMTAPGQRPGPRWLDAVAAHQAKELDRPHSLAEVAANFDVHPIYLARAFRARFGCSPGAYRRLSRIDLAIRRMWDGATNLAGLAGELGFADQSHFTRVFRRHAGVSPARFQRWAGARREVPIVQDGDRPVP